ncbi:hydantoinase/oxoprolinase family protein [Baekduia soli]|uniref:Hydantoinase/oxoprolinase family protein n=1 Tax=Baekduia soli TaxID=496014 RepID=A0A5B8U2N3_9ACTN|nr:hydantoinase/oxoprolinase family protein [Baekduia soli]QEC47233.1 hydantoinase/oxoprolinase family protein [Baekduia soli]
MLGVDVGGTFTDVVAVRDGEIITTKVPTEQTNTEKSVLAGAEKVGVEGATVFNHASTVGLNAIITRRLPKIAFLTSEGHRDILDFGRTWRPLEALTDASWRRTFGDAGRPLVPRYLRRGIRERIRNDGSVLFELDEAQAREQLKILKKCNIEGVAICLLNSYVNADHEMRLRELVFEELGSDIACSISAEVSPLAKEYPRASTTTVDVFMKLIYDAYSTRLSDGLSELGFPGQLNFADCAAQLVARDVAMAAPFRVVFSGPSAGTVASAHFGERIQASNLLCADVGGTSCDISIVTEGQPTVNTTFELEHDLVVNALSTEIASLGAGGGSLISISPAGEVKVGPGSAGADPGPAAYGRGGTIPTMSDAFLLIGILDPGEFAGGTLSLDPALAEKAFMDLDTTLDLSQRVAYAYRMGLNNIAEGIVDISIAHGVDPRDYSLLAFGAAGPMMLPALLEETRVKSVIVPPHPGLFSALGLLSSDLVYADSRTSYKVLTPDSAESIDALFSEMEAGLRKELGEDADKAEFIRTFDARLVGQTWETPFIEVPDGKIGPEQIEEMIESFHVAYVARSGNRFDALPVQGVIYRAQAKVAIEKVAYQPIEARNGGAPKAGREITLRYIYGDEVTALEYHRHELQSGDVIQGPAIIREELSTTQVCPGQTATIGQYGEIIITKGS